MFIMRMGSKNWMRELVKKKLLECEPLLELDGVDKDVLNMCRKDSFSYADFLHKNYSEIKNTMRLRMSDF